MPFFHWNSEFLHKTGGDFLVNRAFNYVNTVPEAIFFSLVLYPKYRFTTVDYEKTYSNPVIGMGIRGYREMK